VKYKFLFLSLLIILGYFLYNKLIVTTKPEVLIITNYNTLTKGNKEAIKYINKTEKQYKIIWFNIIYKKLNDPKYVAIQREKLKNIIKKHNDKLVFIKVGSTSKTLSRFIDMLPTNIPILTSSASIEILKQYKGNVIFSTASLPQWTRTGSMYKIIRLKHLKGIIAIKDGNNTQPYSKVVLNTAKNFYHIESKIMQLKDINKTFLQNHKDYLYMLYVDSSSKAKNMYHKIAKYNVHILNFFSVYSSQLKTIGIDNIFSDSSSISKEKNVFYYSYLGQKVLDKCSYDNRCISDYSSIWTSYYNNVLCIKDLKLKNTSIQSYRQAIYKRLESLAKHYFIEPQTQYVRKFEKKVEGNKTIYFNNAYKDVVDRYLFLFNKGSRILYDYQIPHNIIDNTPIKPIPVVYITTYVNKIDVLDLSATKAKLVLVVKLKSKKDIELGRDITFNVDADYSDSLNLNLVKSSYKNGYFYKTYFVDYVVPLHNNLLYFPFDKAVLNIEYIIKNYGKNPIILQTVDVKNSINSKVSADWSVLKYYASYYQKFFYAEDAPFKIYKEFFTIILQRNNNIQVIVKYFLPAIIILFLAIYISIFITKGYMEEKVEIVTDSLIAIISIYFIYSLLISIKNLIIMDIIFFVMIFLVTFLIIYVLRKKYKK